MNPERIEAMCGGKGHVLIKHILGEKEMNGKCGLYAEVTLEPGCSLGYHEHHGESETYYILTGEGNYDDNGRIRPVSLKTDEKDSHSQKNRNDCLFLCFLIKKTSPVIYKMQIHGIFGAQRIVCCDRIGDLPVCFNRFM